MPYSVLMTNDNFRTVALALQPHISNTYDLLHAADAVVRALGLSVPVTPPQGLNAATPELIAFASKVPAVLDAMVVERKIPAIKELRALTLCTLKAAKDTVESTDFNLALLHYKLTGSVR